MLWGMVHFSHIPSAQFSRILPVRSPKVLRYIYTLRQERLDCMIMHTGWDSVDCWKTKPNNALFKEIDNDRNGVLDSSRLKKDYSHLFKSVDDVRPKNKYRWFGTSLRSTDSKAFSKTHLIDIQDRVDSDSYRWCMSPCIDCFRTPTATPNDIKTSRHT